MSKEIPKLTKDAILKDLLGEPRIFADFMNVTFFNGEKVLNKDNLIPADTEYNSLDVEVMRNILRKRDIAMWCLDEGKVQMICCLENQSTVDKIMAIRVFTYDNLEYERQSRNGDKNIYPCITGILYTGIRKWNGSLNYQEVIGVPEGMEEYFPKCRCLFAWLLELDENKYEEEENRMLVSAMKAVALHGEDREYFKGMKLSRKIALAVAVLLNNYELLEVFEIERGDEMVMCEAIDNLIRKSKMDENIRLSKEIARKMYDMDFNEKVVYQITGITKEDLK